jgi:hypothetical protein
MEAYVAPTSVMQLALDVRNGFSNSTKPPHLPGTSEGIWVESKLGKAPHLSALP